MALATIGSMSANAMRQMADRGAAFYQSMTKHAKLVVAGSGLGPWEDAIATTGPLQPQPQRQPQPQQHQQTRGSSLAPTMVFLGAPGAGARLCRIQSRGRRCRRHLARCALVFKMQSGTGIEGACRSSHTLPVIFVQLPGTISDHPSCLQDTAHVCAF